MSSRTVLTVLLAVSILAAAIAYAGSQLRTEMIYASPKDSGVFQLKGGEVRYCQNAGDPTPASFVACSRWE